ncbi:MAG: DUF4351 domain-containing protein [Magnetococcales bacterium]|nr:DUF4351 domain-containing protein [Magnetococcales bacterium]
MGRPSYPCPAKPGAKTATILTRQLQRRFGDLPPWASQKIADAKLSTLEDWSLRILDATTLESVLADPS